MKYPLARPYLTSKDIAAVTKVLKSGVLSIGPNVKKFEKMICDLSGARFSCAMNSGTAALHAGLIALGVGPGDEVITSPFSFISSANVIRMVGAKPVFVDIESDTFNLDVNNIETAITPNTKAILPVHIFGQSIKNFDVLLKLAKKHHLSVIEDSCESIGATYKNKPLGTFGDVGAFAFYANKQITTGEGGIVITNNKKIYKICQYLRNQGRSESDSWLTHTNFGYNYRLDEMSAALGIEQLKKFTIMSRDKNRIAALYEKYLKKIPNVILPREINPISWFVYYVRVPKTVRNQLINLLSDVGIQSKPYLPSIHLQPCYKKSFGFKNGDFPIAEKISSETIALPFFIGLKERDIIYITNQVDSILRKLIK